MSLQLGITLALVIVNVLVSMAAFNNENLKEKLIFYPPAISENNQWYRFFTSGFIHADGSHLLFNMISLYFFGPLVEMILKELFQVSGWWIYLALYLLALPISLLPTYFKHKYDYNYRGLGASGAVSAVVFAGFLLAPTNRVGFFIIPPIIPAFIFGPLYLLLTAWLDRRGGGNINHSAHLWGALFGIAFIIAATRVAGYDVVGAFVEAVRTVF